ncbi:MAG: hypothetical protein IAF00_02790 [Phycisphaerales bacterium]|nr:hypothetical protein [Phycisphaerales bacterium]
MIDFKQPSTWRGIIGLLSLCGISIDPALATPIAVVAGALLSIIEILRNEYRSRSTKDVTARGKQDTTGPNRSDPAAVDLEPERLHFMPPPSAHLPPSGFNDH